MKRNIFLLGIVYLFSMLAASAQWQTSGQDITFNSGNVGIGTNTPKTKLHVNGRLFLQSQGELEGWQASYLSWTGHRLIMGSLPDVYLHNSVEIRPGGSKQGKLYSLLSLYTASSTNQQELKVRIHSSGISFFNGGGVGIGTTTPEYKLDVVGTIRAHQILVNTQKGADFVFDEDYDLRPIKEVEQFISDNKHLPNIPSANSMVKNSIDVGELQILLLQKIEELTLYIIELEKKTSVQSDKINFLNNELQKLKSNSIAIADEH